MATTSIKLSAAIIGFGLRGMYIASRLHSLDLKRLNIQIFDRSHKPGAGILAEYSGMTNSTRRKFAEELKFDRILSDLSCHPRIAAWLRDDHPLPIPDLVKDLEWIASELIASIGKDAVSLGTQVTEILEMKEGDCYQVVTDKGDTYSVKNIALCTGRQELLKQKYRKICSDIPYMTSSDVNRMEGHELQQLRATEIHILGSSHSAFMAAEKLASLHSVKKIVIIARKKPKAYQQDIHSAQNYEKALEAKIYDYSTDVCRETGAVCRDTGIRGTSANLLMAWYKGDPQKVELKVCDDIDNFLRSHTLQQAGLVVQALGFLPDGPNIQTFSGENISLRHCSISSDGTLELPNGRNLRGIWPVRVYPTRFEEKNHNTVSQRNYDQVAREIFR